MTKLVLSRPRVQNALASPVYFPTTRIVYRAEITESHDYDVVARIIE